MEFRTLLRREFDVNVPVGEAWAAVARVGEWPRWAKHIRAVETDRPLGPGMEGRIRLRNGIRSRFRMAHYDEGKSWLWAGRFLWLHIRYDHLFESLASDRCRITFRVDGAGVGAGSLGRLFAAIYARDLDRAIPNLVALLESDQRP